MEKRTAKYGTEKAGIVPGYCRKEHPMQLFEIQDIKSFTTELFVRDMFDAFELFEADFVTFASFHMDGKIQSDYYDTAERESMGSRDRASWKEMKPFCLSLIRGKRLPLYFKIVLRLPGRHPLCAENGALEHEASSQNLYLNIRYSDKTLTCTTGASSAVFEPGFKPGAEWDLQARTLIRPFSSDVR